MFRTTFTLLFFFSLTNIVFAEDRSTDSLSQEVTSSDKNEALEIMQDHMRSQMDWRSYFTHRMDVQRRARLSGEKLRGEPSTASADQPR
jgi:hypothetical protein